jgi:small-conductance mechanosensitive channel
MQFFMTESPLVKVLGTVVILTLGHLLTRLYKRAAEKFIIERNEGLSAKKIKEIESKIQYTVYVLNAGVIAVALVFLNSQISKEIFEGTVQGIPHVISVILILVLGIIAVNIFTRLASDFISTLGFKNYIRNAGVGREIIELGELALKVVLYLLIIQFIFTQANFAESTVEEFITAASWASVLLAAGLFFYGFKDLFQNLAAGLYLKNSRAVKPGEKVKLEDQTGEIERISVFSTEIDTKDGYSMTVQNQQLMDSKFKFKKGKSDVETLEDIASFFAAGRDESRGLSSIEIALDILGHNINEESLEVSEDSEEEDLQEVIDDETEGEIRTAWIDDEKSKNIVDEAKTWFNDEGLVIARIDRSSVLPSAEGVSYMMIAGVEDSDILLVDPSNPSRVYYAGEESVNEGLKGYLVLTPQDTRASWRIKNDLIYSSLDFYDDLSKNLENRLRKILRQGSIMESSQPKHLSNYIEDWKSAEKASGVWRMN